MNPVKMKRVVFLYSSLNGFVLSTAKALWETGDCESIDIVYWSRGITPGNMFEPTVHEGVRLLVRQEMSVDGIVRLLEEVLPHIVYISGWMDEGYLRAIRRLRSKYGHRFVTVCGIDDQWLGTARQRLGRWYFRSHMRKLFDRVWVAGPPQYHYARQFGYEDQQILYDLLSADRRLFTPSGVCRRFVYVGRLEAEKGPNLLVQAYGALSEGVRKAWPLVMIGDGSLVKTLRAASPPEVTFIPYLQPEDLVIELAKGGVGCHPSFREQWGVSIHELTSMGYPMIVSDVCGAVSAFVIHGYNGVVFRSGDAGSLFSAMRMVSQLGEDELASYRHASVKLSTRITPESAARNLLSADAEWRAIPRQAAFRRRRAAWRRR